MRVPTVRVGPRARCGLLCLPSEMRISADRSGSTLATGLLTPAAIRIAGRRLNADDPIATFTFAAIQGRIGGALQP
jgi:hypothetical protein